MPFILLPQRGERCGHCSALRSKGRPVVRAGDWLRCFGFREEPLLVAVLPRVIGVPAVEERGLLMGVGDTGAQFRQEVQRVEHPEVRLVTRADNVMYRVYLPLPFQMEAMSSRVKGYKFPVRGATYPSVIANVWLD